MTARERAITRDTEGRLPIHLCALILPEEEKEDHDPLDKTKAYRAASLIVEFYCDLSQTDNAGKTPIDYAEVNREHLPTVYKVMLAGQVKQRFEKDRLDRAGFTEAMKTLYYQLKPST